MNQENKSNHMVETLVVEGPVVKVTRKDIEYAMQKLNSRKATGPSEVSVKMIVARRKIGVKVAMDLCQRVLNGGGMPIEWKISIIVPMSKRKGNVMSCGSYREVKLLEGDMKIFERALKRPV